MQTIREKHQTLNAKNIESVKPENNYVLCKKIQDNFEKRTKGGLFKAARVYNRDQYLPQNVERIFQVVALPDKIEDQSPFWKTPIDIKIGDIVYVEYFESLNSKVIVTKENEYRFIRYFKIITIKRDDKLIPINGYILFTRIPLTIKTDLIIPETVKGQLDPRYGIVEFTSPPIEYYFKEDKENDKDVEIEVGDKVIFVMPIEKFAPQLEHSLHITLDKKYFYCHRYSIAGKF